MLQDFTNDSKALTDALKKYSPSISLAPQWTPPSHAAGQGEGSAMMQSATTKMDQITASYGAWVTADEMAALAAELARIPGRKNLLWLSTNFPIGLYGQGTAEFLPQHDRTSGTAWALVKADVAAYPLYAGPAVVVRAAMPALEELAALTGGRAYYDNDVAAEMRDAVGESALSYTLGFYPESSDGKYHALSVEVAREGVEVRCRKGYFAADPQLPVDGGMPGTAEIANALWSPLDATGIALQVRASKGDGTLRLTISAPAADMSATPSVDLVVAEKASSGAMIVAFSESAKPALGSEGLILRREVRLGVGASRIRVVLYDRNTGRLGSLEFPLE